MDDDDDLWGPPRGKSGWINYGIYCFFFFGLDDAKFVFF
jgi:hypothetical protein